MSSRGRRRRVCSVEGERCVTLTCVSGETRAVRLWRGGFAVMGMDWETRASGGRAYVVGQEQRRCGKVVSL